MTMDNTGQRANETGWTKDAIRADKKAKRKAKQAAGRAVRRRAVSAVWDFFLRNLLLWLSIAGLIGLSAWEWWNTSRGWTNLYPAAGALVYFGAMGAVALYFFGFRRWREEGRKAAEIADAKAEKDRTPAERAHLRALRKDSNIWLSVTVTAYFVCVAGVFIATATASEKAQRVAKDSRVELAKLMIDRDDLKVKVELNDPELYQLALDADQRKLDALVDTARGTYGLPDLDIRHANDPVDLHGCPAPPKKFTIERLCAQANGGIDPFNGDVLEGLRTEIKRDEKRIFDALELTKDLAVLNERIRTYPVIQGDETADALGDMFSMNGGTVLSWLLLLLSSAFLYGGGWLGDWVFERVEYMRSAARAAAKAEAEGAC